MSAETADELYRRGLFTETLCLVVGSAILVALLSSLSILYVNRVQSVALPFVVAGIFGYGSAMSQYVQRKDQSERREFSRKEEAVGFALTILHFNALVGVFAWVGVAASAVSMEVGVIAVVAYAFWDVETRSRALPLSVGGVVVLGLVAGILVHNYGRAIVERIEDVDRRSLLRSVRLYYPGAIEILDRPERKPYLIAARHLKR